MNWWILLYVFIGLTILFSLPSTMYLAMFLCLFRRKKEWLMEDSDLKGTQYERYATEIKESIRIAKKMPREDVTISAPDGVKLVGRYYERNSTKTLICVHGYQSSGFNNFSLALREFTERGYNVLLIDQRAHGRSGGNFTTMGDKEQYDLLKWIDWVEKNKPNVQEIYLYGISMGGTTIGLASDKLGETKVKAIVMEGAFNRFYEEISWSAKKVLFKKPAIKFQILALKTFLKADMMKSAEDSLSKTNIPVLFLHTENDASVPIKLMQKNYDACASKKEKIILPGDEHALCFLIGGEKVRQSIFNFLENA